MVASRVDRLIASKIMIKAHLNLGGCLGEGNVEKREGKEVEKMDVGDYRSPHFFFFGGEEGREEERGDGWWHA